MKIPSELKIIGFNWKVKSDKDVTYEGNCFGSTHTQSQTIYLEPGATNTKQNREKTLVHEILHALWWQMGLGKRDDIKKFEEEIIHPLSSGLYQVLKDNNLLK